jgi:hypothetical protein
VKSIHQFEAIENGENIKYEVEFTATLSGLTKYIVKRNSLLVRKGAMSLISLGFLRIFFVFLGLGLVANSLLLTFYINKYIYSAPLDSILLKHIPNTPSDLNYFYINIVIELIFGVFLVVFAFLLKWILLKHLKLITTVFWIRIVTMLAASPFLLWNSIQKQNFLDLRFGIIPWIGYIWLLWFILENSKAIAKDFKSNS